MTIKLAIAGRPTITLSDESITLGSDPTCVVTLSESTGALPKHAVIRKIAGRWLIEVREADSIVVGDAEPQRLFWLKPGDVIRLTEGAPAITFEPDIDAPLPLAAASPALTDVILPPDSHPALPVRRSASSASIPIPKSPSSGTIRTPKSPSSGTIKAAKPTSSGTIKTPKSSSSTTIRTVNPGDGSKSPGKLSRSSDNIPVPGAPLKRKTGQIQIPLDDDDVPADVPTLQRMSSWDEEDPSQRKGLTAEQAEMRWIMMVVGRSVGAGVAVLVLWLGISSVWKAMSPSELGAVSPAPQLSHEQTSVPPTVVSPAPVAPTVTTSQTKTASKTPTQPASVTSENPRTKQPDDRDAIPQIRKPGPDKSIAAAMNTETSQPNTNEKTSSDLVRPPMIGKIGPLAGRGMPGKDNTATTSESDSADASTADGAVKDCIYAVIVEDAKKTKRIQLGTAWAASNRYLVTSATVVAAIDEQREQGLSPSVVQFSTGKALKIKNARLHETFRKALESAEEAREKRDIKRLTEERATQIRFDLGLLDVGRIERLSKKMSSCPEPLDDSNETEFVVVGLPFKQKEADSPKLDPNSLKERRCKKPTVAAAPQNKDMELIINFGPDGNGRNWSGSPVLNKDQKVIGVYSHLPSTGAVGANPVKTEFGVAWIGRLHEFAPEIE